MVHNYYFVFFFVIANMFLLNVLIGFIIDNIVAYLSEEITDEGANKEDGDLTKEQREAELEKGVFGKFYSLYKGSKKMTDNIKNVGIGLLKDTANMIVNESDS